MITKIGTTVLRPYAKSIEDVITLAKTSPVSPYYKFYRDTLSRKKKFEAAHGTGTYYDPDEELRDYIETDATNNDPTYTTNKYIAKKNLTAMGVRPSLIDDVPCVLPALVDHGKNLEAVQYTPKDGRISRGSLLILPAGAAAVGSVVGAGMAGSKACGLGALLGATAGAGLGYFGMPEVFDKYNKTLDIDRELEELKMAYPNFMHKS